MFTLWGWGSFGTDIGDVKARGGGGVKVIFSVFTYVTELLKTNK